MRKGSTEEHAAVRKCSKGETGALPAAEMLPNVDDTEGTAQKDRGAAEELGVGGSSRDDWKAGVPCHPRTLQSTVQIVDRTDNASDSAGHIDVRTSRPAWVSIAGDLHQH
eukprot:SAG22_NODE_2396_length_2619_cov_1.800794_1_plen_109_part_10